MLHCMRAHSRVFLCPIKAIQIDDDIFSVVAPFTVAVVWIGLRLVLRNQPCERSLMVCCLECASNLIWTFVTVLDQPTENAIIARTVRSGMGGLSRSHGNTVFNKLKCIYELCTCGMCNAAAKRRWWTVAKSLHIFMRDALINSNRRRSAVDCRVCYFIIFENGFRGLVCTYGAAATAVDCALFLQIYLQIHTRT